MSGITKFLIGLALTCLIGMASIHYGTLPGNRSDALAKLSAAASDIPAADWVSISADGQKLTITGDAPTPEALTALKTDIGRGKPLGGPFALMDYSGAIAPSLPPIINPHQWVVEKNDTTIVLSGAVPSQMARDDIYALANRHFRSSEISGELELARSSIEEEIWQSAASIAIPALARLENGAVMIDNDQLTLTGEALDDARAGTIRDFLASTPSAFRVETNLTIMAPPSTDLGDVIASIEEDIIEDAPTAASDVETNLAQNSSGQENPLTDNGNVADNVEAAVPEIARPQTPSPKPAPNVTLCQDTFAEVAAQTSINFSTAETDLNAASRSALDQITSALNDCPELNIRIVGHTDSRGSARRNLELSGYRADAVAAYLRASGIAQNRLSTRGAGEENPIASNINAAGRAQNRRIEFQLQ